MATHCPVLPGESHGQRGLAGCGPWGCTESDTPEQLPPSPPEGAPGLWENASDRCQAHACSSSPAPSCSIPDTTGRALEGRSACVRPSGGPSWGRLTSASPAAVLQPTPWPHRPSCPWGTSIEMQVLGAFFIICGRGRIFFPLSITDGILKITAKRNYSENEIKRQYKTDSTLLLIISTDIKLLCQFSINISKCLRSVFVLSPTLCDNPLGTGAPHGPTGRGAPGSLWATLMPAV